MTQRSLSAKPPKKTRRKPSNDTSWHPPRSKRLPDIKNTKPLIISGTGLQLEIWLAAHGAVFRHPELREKERLRSLQRRAAIKAAKPRHEPPKYVSKTPSIDADLEERPASSSTQTRSESAFTFQDYRAADYFLLEEAQAHQRRRGESELPGVGSGRCSPTPDERLACAALTALAQHTGGSIRRVLGEQHHNVDPPHNANSVARSTFLDANQLEGSCLATEAQASWVSPFQDDFIESIFTDLPAGVAPLTAGQMESLRATGTIGLLTPVQSAQMRVAALNSREFTAPTADETAGWLYGGREANWSILDHTRGFEIVRWRTGILKAKRRARQDGEISNDMPQWIGLDDGLDPSAVEAPAGNVSVAQCP
ncbi:hypothetical protein B0H16DRAFT_1712577 [Mycena metata]|uniref:Uncharacterized protein n=1 Tax=Mycena metata TaxID=1033252 RepID=A0AAD7K196_9AGAR|nr:hypothetical protein B0H16DRAFT_1712577 [Mycena metata]